MARQGKTKMKEGRRREGDEMKEEGV